MKRIATILATIAISITALAGNPYSYKGTTDSKVMGKQEYLDNMVLVCEQTDEGLSVSLKDYQVIGYKDMSITGVLTLDDEGNIIGFDKVVIKGAPAKAKSVTGKLTDKNADIRLTGKAAGMFNFDIHYTATINK